MAIVGSAEIVLTARLDRLERELRQAEQKVTGFSGRAGASVGALGTKLLGLGASTVGVAAVGAALYKLGSGAISASSQVEQLKTRIDSLLGSTSAAASEYARLAKIAASTPFELNDVVQAGVTIKSFGDQNAKTAAAVADLAAFMGTTATEAASAYGRAFAGGVGAADILRERGVLPLVQAISGLDDLTKATLPQFREALLSAMVDTSGPIAGAAVRLSKTWGGAVLNVSDSIEMLQASLGDIVTGSDAARSTLIGAKDQVDLITASVSAWTASNRDLIDVNFQQFVSNFTGGLDNIDTAVGRTLESLTDLETWYNRFANAGKLGALGAAAGATAGAAFGPGALATGAIGGTVGALGGFFAEDLNPMLGGADIIAARRAGRRALLDQSSPEEIAAGMSMFQGTGTPAVVGRVGADSPPSTGGAGTGTKVRKPLTPQQRLGDVLGLQRDLLDAATSQLDTQIGILERQKGKATEIAALEKQRLETIRASLDSQVALLRAQGTDAGGLARAEADLANVTAELAAPAAVVADEFERATVAAERLGSTLSEDILGSVKQFVVGVSQGTAKLGDLPRILSQSTAGNVTSRIFDSAFGAGGLFGTGTGAGDFGAFGAGLSQAFGFTRGNAPPEGFTGPPLASGATSAAGDMFAIAGNLASSALALGSVAQALGVGNLFKDKPSAEEKTRRTLDDAFKAANLFPTLALSKNPPSRFRAKGIPSFLGAPVEGFSAAAAFFGGQQPAADFTGPGADQLQSLGFLLGLKGTQAEGTAPREVGFRAGFLGLTSEQTSQQNRQVARATGKSIAEGVNDITVAFLRYQQEGKGAEITQADYNRVVGETVKLLQDDLPAGIDASVFALGALEKFGDQQVVNLETLTEKLQDVADAAQGFGSAFADGIARAVDSGNVMDVSRAIGESFAQEFQDQTVAAILKSGAFAADLQSAIALTTEAAQLAAAGDFAGAAVLQARLGDTFSGVAGRAVQASAPLIQSVRGLEAALGVAAGNGVVRQGPSTLVTQVVVDGRVVQESQQDLTRLQRGGGVVVPQQISTR